MNKWLKTILFLLGSAFLTRLIPFSSLFRNLDTMIHEFGHALVTLILSGSVLRIELYANHSGVTYSAIQAGGRSILVSLAGYTLASLFSLLFFYLYARGQQKWGLILTSGVALVMLLLYVRGGFGMIWLSGFIALNIVMIMAGKGVQTFYYLLVAFITLEESVIGPLFLVTTALFSPSRAGDASNLAQLTPLPSLFWALLFFLFSLLCAKGALGFFFKKSALRMSGQV